MNEAMTRVATGMKINSAKDGASVYAISERMRNQIRANDQANQNTQNDSALLKTAQGGISNTIAILNTLKERAINSANDSNLNMNRGDIATEVQQLALQIDDNANKVKFNGRNLLNGAVDNTVGRLNGASSVNEGATVSTNPTATSTHAVYSLNNLYKWDGSKAVSAAGGDNLVDLVKGNATAAGDTLFHKDDKITFSWRENGALVTKETTIGATTKISELATLLGGSDNLKADFLTSSSTTYLESEDTAGTTPYTGGTEKNVLNSTDFSKLSTLDAGGAGIYAVGKKDVAITDFSVTVVSGGNIKTDAQEALKFRGVQQGYGEKTGSNAVVSSQWFNGATDSGISATNSTAFKDWKVYGGSNPVFASDTTSIKFDVITSEGAKSIEFGTGNTLEDLNKRLESIGIQATIAGKGETVTYNGATVTRSSGGNDSALKSPSAALYFVAADGVDINSVSITADKAYTTKGLTDAAGTANTALELTRVQNRAENSAANAGASASLTFFVGGEPNFGIDVSISKMTTEALLGTNAQNFASKFLTKEGAQSAISTIDDALNRALNEQTKLGAMEARLGYTSDNLTTMNENLEASDSVMRDSDVAKEMTNYMKYSVLAQASQYMLAQAGQNAFSVLNLLQQ
jgi:flagellin